MILYAHGMLFRLHLPSRSFRSKPDNSSVRLFRSSCMRRLFCCSALSFSFPVFLFPYCLLHSNSSNSPLRRSYTVIFLHLWPLSMFSYSARLIFLCSFYLPQNM